jgi:hypothetical protein
VRKAVSVLAWSRPEGWPSGVKRVMAPVGRMGGAGVSGSEEGSSEVAEVRVMTGVVLVVFIYSFIKD